MQDFCIVSDFYARLPVRMWSNLFIIIMISHTRFICFLCNSIYVSFIWHKYYLSFRQTNGFSPMWNLRCTFNSPLCVNFLSQSGQAERLFASVNCYNAYSIRYFVSTSCHNQDRRTVFHRCEFYGANSIFHCVWTLSLLIIHFIYKNIDIIYWYQSSLKPTFQWFRLLQSGWDPFWVDYTSCVWNIAKVWMD